MTKKLTKKSLRDIFQYELTEIIRESHDDQYKRREKNKVQVSKHRLSKIIQEEVTRAASLQRLSLQEASLASDVRQEVQRLFGKVQTGSDEEKTAAERQIAALTGPLIADIENYEGTDAAIIRRWKEVIEDNEDAYPTAFAALTDVPAARAAAEDEEAVADSVVKTRENSPWSYKVEDEVWHTQKEGWAEDKWVSLAPEKYRSTRVKLDAQFPDMRGEQEEGPGDSGGAQVARVDLGLSGTDYNLTRKQVQDTWDDNVSQQDMRTAKANPTKSFNDGIEGMMTDEGLVFAALYWSGGFAGIDTDSDDYTFGDETPEDALRNDMSGQDQQVGLWLGDADRKNVLSKTGELQGSDEEEEEATAQAATPGERTTQGRI